MQHGTNKRLRRHVPHEPGDVSLTLVDGQFQASALEPEKGLADTALLTKDPKHLLDGLLHPLIGIFDDLSTGVAHVTRREQADQFTATGFRLRPLLHTLRQYFEFRHTHRCLDPQHQLVIERTDLVDGVGIGNQRVKQRAQLQ
jgi:hypothetical protein